MKSTRITQTAQNMRYFKFKYISLNVQNQIMLINIISRRCFTLLNFVVLIYPYSRSLGVYIQTFNVRIKLSRTSIGDAY
jgi:hypothetical protein